jgi:hypothetical protein
MKDEESIPKMFYRLHVIINDLKSLDENVKDEDFSHKSDAMDRTLSNHC